MLLLKFRQFALAGTLVLLASAGLVALQYGTAYAADYPKDWCEFRMAGDKSSLTGSCDDAKNNGSFSGASFSKSSELTYTFTDSYWRYVGPGNFPVTSHDKFTDAPGNVTPEEIKCKPAIIKMSTDGKTASVSGQYASVPPSSPSPLLNGQWQCTDLLEGEVKVTKVSVRMMAWRKAFYDSLLKSIPLLECKRFNKNSDNYNMCAKGMGLVVASCVGPNGSVWTDTKSYASDAEQKKAYKESTVACFDRKLSRTSKPDIKNAVEAAYSNAEKEENKVVDTTGPTTTTTTDEEEPSSCDIDGIGWLVCPVLTFMAKLNDQAFKVISGFLEIEPTLLADDGAKPAWESFRNIANFAFVIAFLIIIYSQMTGAGVSNYGLKKLLPKLIIAAILVNMSYYICQIAVDLSNIVGSSIYGFFKDIPIDAGGSASSTGPGWHDTVSKMLMVASAILAAVLLAVTLGGAALLAFALVVLILIARKAIIILLIVIAPLAFVAYLLPNTEQWFKKWLSLFGKLLMVYPVIGVLFGAGFLASRIVNNAATGGGDDQIMLQLTALGIMAVPLFAVPMALKGAMAATGAIGAKLNGWQDKATGAAGRSSKERMKRKAESMEAKMAGSNNRAARFAGGYRNRRAFRRKSMETATSQGQEEALAAHIGRHPSSYTDRERATAIAAKQKMSRERIDNSMALLQNGKAEDLVERAVQQLKQANESGDVEGARAATQLLTQKTGSRGIEEFHQAIRAIEANGGGLNADVSEGVRSDVSSAGLKGKDRALDTWSRFEGDKKSLVEHDDHAGTATSLNESELAGQSVRQLDHFSKSGSMSQQQAQRVLDSHKRGTIHLDETKLGIFEERAASQQVRDVDEAHDQANQENARRSSAPPPPP